MSTSQNASPYSDLDKVPDDILLEIFHHLLSPPDITIQENDTWIPVTLSHVCSNWRCLTLASPLLWTNIFPTSFSNPAILRQYLTRSGDALLRINIAPPIISNVDLLAQTLSSQSHRFVSFHLHDVDGDKATEVLSFFTSPAPQLRSLHIRPLSDTDSLDTVFNDQMPLLTDMEITANPKNLLARRNLTRLFIHAAYVETDRLMNLLRACPTLESLELECLSQPDDASRRLRSRGTPVILLKCLRELYVHNSNSADMVILPYLSFPKTTVVKLGYLRHSELVTVLCDCTSLRETASDVKMTTLELCPDTHFRYVNLRSPQLEIQVWDRHTAPEFTGFSAMPFQALSHLTIRDNGCPFPEYQWRHSFQRIPTLTHMEVCVKDVTTLAILHVIGTNVSDAETVLCPELTHLVLSGDVDEGQAVCEEMLSCCLARAAAGAPIISCEIALKTREEIPTPVLARLDEIGVQIINPSNTA
ncbi:hypothetical protein B0H21DRAFT_828021 [Amylocystis lapponica]|nr:hypothetical protein B0H21DRAFT_828021 [Amylocystis lapponica]